MTLRPESTTSERELLDLMIKTGRDVTLATLADWRKGGLLPPLASRGAGQGKGKYYYWHEENIFEQACFVYDIVRKRGRVDSVILALWLSGFNVPLPKLRRAWLHKARAQRPWGVRQAKTTSIISKQGKHASLEQAKTDEIDNSTSRALIYDALLATAEVLTRDGRASELESLERLVDKVLATMALNNRSIEKHEVMRMLGLVRVVWSALETSNLISVASNPEMFDSQRHLSIVAQIIETLMNSRNLGFPPMGAPFWSAGLAEDIGAPVFAFILMFLRAGCERQLEETSVELAKLGDHLQGISKFHKRGNSTANKIVIATFRQRILTIWQTVLPGLGGRISRSCT